jgi:hypothetical protein
VIIDWRGTAFPKYKALNLLAEFLVLVPEIVGNTSRCGNEWNFEKLYRLLAEANDTRES